ncbi:MAG: hypothetical protein ACREPI_03935 [Candidatus Dormibacterales bacterium]
MDLDHLLCWLRHRSDWEILVPGVLPLNLDAIAFCWHCDRCRGRGVRVFEPRALSA